MSDTLRLVAGEDGDAEDGDLTLDVGAVSRVLAPTNVELLKAIATEQPGSIRATAAAVDRDVKNVHENLMELSRLGLVEFEWDGNARRPVVAYDSLSVSIPLTGSEADDESDPAGDDPDAEAASPEEA